MFTGLVGATGVLAGRTARGPGARLVVQARLAGEALAHGESITVDGACLSVTEVLPDGFAIDATAEIVAKLKERFPNISGPHKEDICYATTNRQRALLAGDRLGGHIVTGHVDAVGTLASRREVGEALALQFTLPADLAHYVAEKGSITLNGVSMTVNAAGKTTFDVMVIPITRSETNLGALEPGARVNVEVDLVARYVARWLTKD